MLQHYPLFGCVLVIEFFVFMSRNKRRTLYAIWCCCSKLEIARERCIWKDSIEIIRIYKKNETKQKDERWNPSAIHIWIPSLLLCLGIWFTHNENNGSSSGKRKQTVYEFSLCSKYCDNVAMIYVMDFFDPCWIPCCRSFVQDCLLVVSPGIGIWRGLTLISSCFNSFIPVPGGGTLRNPLAVNTSTTSYRTAN